MTFTAQDEVSGVDHFTWSYAKEANASNVNKDTGDSAYTLQTVDAVQDKEKPEQFSATVVLPRGERRSVKRKLYLCGNRQMQERD